MKHVNANTIMNLNLVMTNISLQQKLIELKHACCDHWQWAFFIKRYPANAADLIILYETPACTDEPKIADVNKRVNIRRAICRDVKLL